MMNLSIEEYAEWQSRRRLRRRTYPIVPASIKEKLGKIENAGAVLWDVYGTLMAVSVGDLENGRRKKELMLEALRRTAREFGLMEFLGSTPEDTLMEMYLREIEKTHHRKRSHGSFSPEVRIEDIWLRILKKLESAGYKPPSGKTEHRTESGGREVNLDLALKIAYFFDDVYHTKRLYPDARETLEGVKRLGLLQGIISNAQFYTPIALNILLCGGEKSASSRWESGDIESESYSLGKQAGNDKKGMSAARRPIRRHDVPLRAGCPRISSGCLTDLFDGRLLFFSYCLGVSKPNPHAFELAQQRLKKTGIPPEHVLYVGNDLHSDMTPARAVGFKCVLHAGDKESLILRKDHSDCRDLEPDAIIKSLPQLLSIIGGKHSAAKLQPKKKFGSRIARMHPPEEGWE
ncbi:HAD hydrolase-like protein [Candidatus Poribacteria bacterium]|nr:HAD hydrolase-like protein [Candidatus Poribacteria bacterium]